ncbi:hypothetical protein LCGC14_1606790, partial [marine sediment metagenome]
MSEEKYIEEAEIVVDLSGGHLAAQAYRKRIKQLQAELDTAKMVNVKFEHLAIEQARGFEALQSQLDKANEKIQELHKQVEFWMSEDDGSTWPPENTAWRKLLDVKKKTAEQLKEMQRLVPIIMWKMDERLQYERAEQLQAKLDKAKA